MTWALYTDDEEMVNRITLRDCIVHTQGPSVVWRPPRHLSFAPVDVVGVDPSTRPIV